MKKTLFLISLVLLSLPVLSQGRRYTKSMKSAIEKMNEAPDPVSELETATSFEEIALNYPDQWLPSYHASRILVFRSFEESDGSKSDILLDRAKKSLDKAMKMVPEESEVHVLEAFYYIGMISADPDTRGQLYYQNVLDAIQKSRQLNPENPRAYYVDGMMTLNMPEFLGGGPEAAKPILLEAQEKFQTFGIDDPLWPTWGEDLNQGELDRLKK